jgi:acetate---CoA ligase (ADP-forming)
MFYPKGIILVGVSRKENTLGRILLDNLIDFGYPKEKILVLNPNTDIIGEVKCVAGFENLPVEVNLMILLVRRELVKDIIIQANKFGINDVIIITAGFREVGNEGIELEKELVKVVKSLKVNVVGPNSMGLLHGKSRLNATFTPIKPKSGNIGFLSQSGAIGAVLTHYANQYNLGYSVFVSLGNKIDWDENYMLKKLAEDIETKVIIMYLESFSNAKDFIKIACKLDKPLIVIKSGRTDQGAKAAASHTGALTGSDVVVNSALEKINAIRSLSIHNSIEISYLLQYNIEYKLGRVGIISNAGGPGTITTDALVEYGFILNEFSTEIKSKLDQILPKEASIGNPCDILPSSGPKGYADTVEILLKDEDIDIIVIIFLPPVVNPLNETLNLLNPLVKDSLKPVVGIYVGGDITDDQREKLTFPVFSDIETAALTMNKVHTYKKKKSKLYQTKIPGTISISSQKVELPSLSNTFLDQKTTHQLLDQMQIKYPKFVYKNIQDLSENLDDLQFPIVMKLASNSLSHKTEVGGVFLNIQNTNQYREKIKQIESIYTKEKVILQDQGVLMQEFVSKGIELLIGVKKDSEFGHVITVGWGGIYINLINDAITLVPPLSSEEIFDKISTLKVYKLLKGYRGGVKYDINHVVDIILNVEKLVIHYPEIKELDINPVIINENGIFAVDTRILI